MTDRIFIEGIKFHGFHGLTKLERQVGVRLCVDVEIEVDLERSGKSDRVSDTIDYRRIHARVVDLGRNESHRLLESFVRRVIHDLFDRFEVDRIRIRCGKETPVLDGIVDSVGVEMVRTRDEVRGA